MAQVVNKDVANASGSQVRADINNIYEAIATNNFGNKSSAGQILPCELVADNSTTPKKLLIRSTTGNDGTNGTPTFFEVGDLDTDNLGLLKKSGGSMDGVLALINGNAGTPSINVGDSSTGFYRKAANKISFSASGTEQLFLDQDGITLQLANEIRFADANSSHYVGIKAPNNLGSNNRTITLPDETGTLLTTASTIASSQISGAAITLGSTNIALGSTASSLAGLSALTATTVSGTTGNITTVNATTVNATNLSGVNSTTITTVNSTTQKASRFRSSNSSTPVFQNSSGSETAAGRLVRALCHFDSYRGGAANDNYASIRRSFNVSSVTDHSEGVFTINFTTNLPNRSTTTTAIDYHRFTFNNHCQCYLDSENGANAGNVKIRIIASTNSGGVLDKSSVNVINCA